MKEQELDRLKHMLEIEDSLYKKGYKYVCGVDEAGRGPLCGPVVAAAVILPKDECIEGVNDSKKVSEKKREKLYDQILEEAISYGVGIIGQDEIDEIMPKINGKPSTKSTFNDTSYYLSSTESNEKGVFYYMTGAQTIYTLPALHPIVKDGLEYYYVRPIKPL